MTTSLIAQTAIIIFLLLLSSLFSASETAVIAASKALLHNRMREGDHRAKIISTLRRNMGRLISTLLIGNTIINILATTLATSVLIKVFGEAGVAYATFIMSCCIIIYGEVMPKILAINYPEATACQIALPLRAAMAFLSPLTQVIDGIARQTLRLLGVKINPNVNTTHADELRGLIELHAGPGEEVPHERAMLRSILDLSKVEVDQIMTHRKNIAMIDADEPIEKAIEHILELPYSRLPIWKDNPENIIGVLRVKDFFRALRSMKGDLQRISLPAIAVKPWFIPESTTLFDQLQAFRERREHFALVVDEYGALMGIVTLEDILEEIVGEISDEHDIELQGVRASADGSFIVAGTVTIRDLNRQFEWNLPAEEASTIAGLVLHEARLIPQVGQAFTIDGFLITVLRRHRQQITLLKITPPRVTPEREEEE